MAENRSDTAQTAENPPELPVYEHAVSLQETGTVEALEAAVMHFRRVEQYADAKERIAQCMEKIEQLEAERTRRREDVIAWDAEMQRRRMRKADLLDNLFRFVMLPLFFGVVVLAVYAISKT